MFWLLSGYGDNLLLLHTAYYIYVELHILQQLDQNQIDLLVCIMQ